MKKAKKEELKKGGNQQNKEHLQMQKMNKIKENDPINKNRYKITKRIKQ